MTAIDHHSMIGDTVRTPPVIQVAAAVVGTVGLQKDRLFEHVASLSSLLCNLGFRCFCEYFEHHVQHLFFGQCFSHRCLSVASEQLTPLIFVFSSRLRISFSSNLLELWCAGFRHSAGLHARVILDGATCRLRELGDVRDVLSVLGVLKDRQVKKKKCSWRNARERTTMDETWVTPDDNTYFGAQRWQCNT